MIGITLLLFVGAMGCCWWRIGQSNRIAKEYEKKERAREEEVERRMVERIRKARRQKARERRRKKWESSSEEEVTSDSSGATESEEIENVEKRTLIAKEKVDDGRTRDRNLSDEELESRRVES
jgi:hypothetical protein